MGRPREYDEERTTTTLRISTDLLGRVNAEADRRELGRNKLMLALIEWALPDYEGETL
jgi:hypothetical protein